MNAHKCGGARQWNELSATKQPKKYDEAVALLGDLRELAARDGKGQEHSDRLQRIEMQHEGKTELHWPAAQGRSSRFRPTKVLDRLKATVRVNSRPCRQHLRQSDSPLRDSRAGAC